MSTQGAIQAVGRVTQAIQNKERQEVAQQTVVLNVQCPHISWIALCLFSALLNPEIQLFSGIIINSEYWLADFI